MPASREDIAHLLRRTEYVARPSRIDELAALELPAVVDDVLDVSRNPAAVPPPDTLVAGSSYEQLITAAGWWLNRMVDVPRPVQEKMTWFWHGHLCSHWWKVGDSASMLAQNQLFRSAGMGSFRDLIQQMSIQPAMLHYLDNRQNVAGNENQNFARELMELFTLGVGNYTEDDVISAARAWTGHSTGTSIWDDDNYWYVFRPEHHDFGVKTFSGATMAFDGPDIVERILVHDTGKRRIAARFIARKMWEHFAYQRPGESLVDALADVFVASGLDVTALLRAIFLRAEFYSTQARQGSVRSPVDYSVALMACTGLRCAAPDGWHFYWLLSRCGHEPFLPPNVSGWRLNGYWVNTSALDARASMARQFTWALREQGFFSEIPTLSVDDALARAEQVFGVSFSDPTRTALRDWLVEQRTFRYDTWWEATNFLTLVMATPEMHLH
jgi:uncharacterized protein (DUF1800 family)